MSFSALKLKPRQHSVKIFNNPVIGFLQLIDDSFCTVWVVTAGGRFTLRQRVEVLTSPPCGNGTHRLIWRADGSALLAAAAVTSTGAVPTMSATHWSS